MLQYKVSPLVVYLFDKQQTSAKKKKNGYTIIKKNKNKSKKQFFFNNYNQWQMGNWTKSGKVYGCKRGETKEGN